MDCPYFQNTSYGVFSERLHQKVLENHIPIAASVELTSRCNLQCVHCYINKPITDQHEKKSELSTKEWIHIIDQMVDEGCLWLLITGGESLIRDDFFTIYNHAKKKGLLITLFTNGTAITPAILDLFSEYPPFETEITVYGRTQETYEQITGIPNSHHHCYKAIDEFIKNHIPLRLKTMVLTLNQHEVWDMKAFAEERGLEFRYDPMINKRLDGSQNPERYKLSPTEITDFEKNDEKRIAARREFYLRSKRLLPPMEYLYLCGAGSNNCHIDSQGNLSLCIMSRYPSYDLRKGNFHEGWKTFIPSVREQKRSKEIPCSQCEIISLCDHCPGWAHIETGDPEEWVAYLCETAHLRARAIGIDKEYPIPMNL